MKNNIRKKYIFIVCIAAIIFILLFALENFVKAAYTTINDAGSSSFPNNDKYTYIEVNGPSGVSTLKLQVQQTGKDKDVVYKNYKFDNESRDLAVKTVSVSNSNPYKLSVSTNVVSTTQSSSGQYSWINIKVKYTIPAHEKYGSVDYDSPSSKSHKLTNIPQHRETIQSSYETSIGLSAYDTGVAPYRNPSEQKYYRYYNCKVTIYLKKDKYTVNYKGNGGNIDKTSQSKEFNCGDLLTFPETKRDGYTFLGWKDSEDDSGNSYNIKSIICGKGITLYAQWKANQYNIHYNANGGKGDMSDSTVIYDSHFKLPQNTFERSGYSFVGWNEDDEAFKAEFKDEEIIPNLTDTDKTINLYAVWKKNDGNFNITNIIHDQEMFRGDVRIEGEKGTMYDDQHTDSEYAKIDKDNEPGYFSNRFSE